MDKGYIYIYIIYNIFYYMDKGIVLETETVVESMFYNY